MKSQYGLQTISIYILPSISRSKRNQTMKFLAIVISFEIWKNENVKKLRNSIFDGRLIVNQTFSQTEFIFDKSDFAHIIIHFH